MLSVYSNQIVISTIIYIQESFYGGASCPNHSFKNFNKHVKYKIQQPQLFIDYNLYIVQKHFSFHMFPNGKKIKHITIYSHFVSLHTLLPHQTLKTFDNEKTQKISFPQTNRSRIGFWKNEQKFQRDKYACN